MLSPTLGTTSGPSLLSLPTEVLECIIAYTFAIGTHRDITSIALTCSTLRTVVYGPSCGYLWHTIFLSKFDDPSSVSKHLARMGIPSQISIGMHKEFDWAQALKSRISAALYFRTSTRIPDFLTQHTPSSESDDSDSAPSLQSIFVLRLRPPAPSLDDLPKALDHIMSTINTERPYPTVPMIAFGSPSTTIEGLAGSPFPAYPAFPPLMLLFATMRIGNPYPEVLESMNTNWLHDVLRTGYPPELVHRILPGSILVDHPIFRDWPSSPLARTFFRMMTHTGFIPMPYLAPESESKAENATEPETNSNAAATPQEDSTTSVEGSSPTEREETPQPGPAPVPQPSSTTFGATRGYKDEGKKSFPFIPPEEQYSRVRRWARTTVYNLRYLWSDRQWGPFLPLTEDPPPATRRPHAVPQHVQVNNTNDDDDDDDTDSNEEWADDDLVPLINTHPRPGAAASSSSTSVSASQLKPDWMFLAAVRILVEMNLRDSLGNRRGREDIDLVIEGLGEALQRLDGGRVGGAPGYWHGLEGYERILDERRRKEQEDQQEQGIGSNFKGKGKEKDEGDGEEKLDGWDWAGVEGQWKRCICWLDYRDLLTNNLHSSALRFQDPTLEEVIRIVPMTIRISGYSYPDDDEGFISADGVRLPMIHVEGEVAGQPLEPRAVRRVKGTVSMIADGTVRWSFFDSFQTMTHHGSLVPEWASEGVQLGGVGSALGILGLWTGADHERTDPLGPFWAWKVA